MLAVLESAIEISRSTSLHGTPAERSYFQQAEEWFLEKDSDELFSFRNICETFDQIREPTGRNRPICS
jgi:hypothetical protein